MLRHWRPNWYHIVQRRGGLMLATSSMATTSFVSLGFDRRSVEYDTIHSSIYYILTTILLFQV